MEQKMIGRYFVTNPNICHGKPTFRGTRIMAWQVLEQVAEGSARVGLAYRVLAVEDGDDFIWVWIGDHDEYERMIG